MIWYKWTTTIFMSSWKSNIFIYFIQYMFIILKQVWSNNTTLLSSCVMCIVYHIDYDITVKIIYNLWTYVQCCTVKVLFLALYRFKQNTVVALMFILLLSQYTVYTDTITMHCDSYKPSSESFYLRVSVWRGSEKEMSQTRLYVFSFMFWWWYCIHRRGTGEMALRGHNRHPEVGSPR